MAKGNCDDCANIRTCKKYIGIRFGFCNTDFVSKDEVNENDNDIDQTTANTENI